MTEARYVRVIVDLSPTFAFLERHLGDYQVNFGIVIGELLKELFDRPPGFFGREQGARGAFLAQARLLSVVEERDMEMFLHEAHKVLIDDLTSILPHLDGNAHEQHYAYHGDRFMAFYQPVVQGQCPPDLYAHSVDAHALLNFTRSTR